jgi:MFS family permease
MTASPAFATAEVRPVDIPSTPVNKMPKIAFAALMGTVIEFYDFIIYGTAAALVFAKAFFPSLGAASGTVVSFATLGIAFIARPFGAFLFGHFGDRLGRKGTLLATMATMGIATVLIGMLPTADKIGVLAPILLVILRIAQGIAAGGEWAGAALFLCEHSPAEKRGFWSMFTNLGGSIANMLALSTFFVSSLAMSDKDFIAWGWRIPFLISIVFVVVGLYIRMKIQETPVFQRELRQRGTSNGLPFADAVRNQWREILLGAGTLIAAFSFNYLGAAYLINYGTATLAIGRSAVLGAGIFGGFMLAAGVVSGGHLSDRFGRRGILLAVNSIGVVWSLLLFPLLDMKSLPTFLLGLSISFFLAGHAFGVAGSFLSELFATRYRYTAAGLAYSLAGVVGGAMPPIIAASMIPAYGGLAFGAFLACLALVGVFCTKALRETRHESLEKVPATTR